MENLSEIYRLIEEETRAASPPEANNTNTTLISPAKSTKKVNLEKKAGPTTTRLSSRQLYCLFSHG